MHGIEFIQDLAVILVVAGVVGWICQRLGLSVIVGFLVAGLVVGPHTPPFALVSDLESIDTFAQLGLVFLMFGIGLKLSMRKLRRLGPSLLLAVGSSAVAVYYLTRLLGLGLGLSATESLFLAGMLMVSSSAIIAKILQETGSTHERFGQLAMGVSVLEDVVAVVMLTILNSLIHFGDAQSGTPVMETLGRLGAFVVLAGIAGLLLVPWLLRRMSIAADDELQTLGIAGLLFGMAFVAQFAGYSLALGAFLLGTIVAETPHRSQVERTFEGMRDVFSAVFFVAIGMQIDLRVLWSSGWLVLAVSAFTLAARPLAVSSGLILIGTPARDALRAGLVATPIGEFSFIIAQLGVVAAVVDKQFYPLAVGISLLTTLTAPLLTRHSERLADAIVSRHPRWLQGVLQQYQGWRERLQHRQARNVLWQLSRRRVMQLAVGMLFVTGVVVFSGQLFDPLQRRYGTDWLFPHGLEITYWAVIILIALAPLVAIWRNISAMSMLYAEVSTKGNPRQASLRPMIETGIKAAAALLLLLWLAAILPDEDTAGLLLLFGVLFAAGAVFILRRRLIYWHSEVEVGIQGLIQTESHRMTATTAPWLRPHQDWNLHMSDCVVPDLADSQGKRIADLELRSRCGCTVVGIERQGFMIPLPSPDTALYPRDKVLLMGTTDQLKAGRKLLGAVSGNFATQSEFEEVRMEAVRLPAGSPADGRTLADIAPMQSHGVLIAGINRAGLRILNPSAQEKVAEGDELLALGTPEQIVSFKAWAISPS